jgi:hypothetical protein
MNMSMGAHTNGSDNSEWVLPPDTPAETESLSTIQAPLTFATTAEPSLEFRLDENPTPVLEFHTDGKVYVRGELVDNNKEIYSAIVDFLYNVRQIPHDSQEYRRREGLDKPPESRGMSRFEILKNGTPAAT